ncbi:MAG: hypothetical protein Q4Q42_01255, partial [Planctomycetia bacterium]|nr:hypothetical protein [Planctomycetia bacterium]
QPATKPQAQPSKPQPATKPQAQHPDDDVAIPSPEFFTAPDGAKIPGVKMAPSSRAEKPRPRHSGDAPFQGSRLDSDENASTQAPQAEYDEELSASFNRLLSVAGKQPAATRAQKEFLPDLHAAPQPPKDSDAKEKAPEKVDAPEKDDKAPGFLGKIIRKFFGKK